MSETNLRNEARMRRDGGHCAPAPQIPYLEGTVVARRGHVKSIRCKLGAQNSSGVSTGKVTGRFARPEIPALDCASEIGGGAKTSIGMHADAVAFLPHPILQKQLRPARFHIPQPPSVIERSGGNIPTRRMECDATQPSGMSTKSGKLFDYIWFRHFLVTLLLVRSTITPFIIFLHGHWHAIVPSDLPKLPRKVDRCGGNNGLVFLRLDTAKEGRHGNAHDAILMALRFSGEWIQCR
mmetsp:Transcript_2696/g.7919  ORF Transcript_2696/g.7919 Transcript_2696/m.7919 type:complete len:237 (+) Transcript_2696:374-1084(+)